MSSPRTLLVVLFGSLFSASMLHAQPLIYHHRSTALGDSLAGAAELTAAQGSSAKDWAEAYSTLTQAEYGRAQFIELRSTAARRHREQEKVRLAERRLRNMQKKQLALNSLLEEANGFAKEVQSGSATWPVLFEHSPYRQLRNEIEGVIRRYQVGSNNEVSEGRGALSRLAKRARQQIQANPTNAAFADRVRAMRTVKFLEVLAEPVPSALTVASNN